MFKRSIAPNVYSVTHYLHGLRQQQQQPREPPTPFHISSSTPPSPQESQSVWRFSHFKLSNPLEIWVEDLDEARSGFVWEKSGETSLTLLAMDNRHIGNVAKILFNRIAKSLSFKPIIVTDNDHQRYIQGRDVTESGIRQYIVDILVLCSELQRRKVPSDIRRTILMAFGAREFIRHNYADRIPEDILPGSEQGAAGGLMDSGQTSDQQAINQVRRERERQGTPMGGTHRRLTL